MKNFKVKIKKKIIKINNIKLNFKMLYRMTFIEDEMPYPDGKVTKKIKQNTRLYYDKNKELWIIISIKNFILSNNFIAYNFNTKAQINFNGYPAREMLNRLDSYKETENNAKIQLLNNEFENKSFKELMNSLSVLV